MNKVMKKRDKQLWEEYLTIKGGDFPDWYEGLSPFESYLLAVLHWK